MIGPTCQYLLPQTTRLGRRPERRKHERKVGPDVRVVGHQLERGPQRRYRHARVAKKPMSQTEEAQYLCVLNAVLDGLREGRRRLSGLARSNLLLSSGAQISIRGVQTLPPMAPGNAKAADPDRGQAQSGCGRHAHHTAFGMVGEARRRSRSQRAFEIGRPAGVGQIGAPCYVPPPCCI